MKIRYLCCVLLCALQPLEARERLNLKSLDERVNGIYKMLTEKDLAPLSLVHQLQQEVSELRSLVGAQEHELSVLKARSMSQFLDLDRRLKKVPNLQKPGLGSLELIDAEQEAQFLQGVYQDIVLKRFDEAVASLDSALSQPIKPEYRASLQYALGEVYLTRFEQLEPDFESLDRAQAAYEKSAQASPQLQADAAFKLARILEHRGQFVLSCNQYDALIKSHPHSTAAYLAALRVAHINKH